MFRIEYLTDPIAFSLAIHHTDIFAFVDSILGIYLVILYGLHNPKVEHKCKLQANLLAYKVIGAELPVNLIADI